MATLLELTVDTAPRDVIRIDGKDYTLRRGDDLSIQDNLVLGRDLRRFAQLTSLNRNDIPAAEVEELGKLLVRICRVVLAAPPRVLKAITPVQQVRIVNVFLMLSLTSLPSAKALLVASGSLTSPKPGRAGTRSSRGSAGSTAAPRSRGGRATP